MKRIGLAAACVLLAIAFVALGVWQLERRAWKLDLIAKVDAGVKAAPLALRSWSQVGPEDAYRRVVVRGVFLHDRETLVQALTEAGGGWWVLTPLRTPAGDVLINRGFVPPERRDAATRLAGSPRGPVTIVGLMRVSERRGGFLRANAPAAGRWYSRDVASIAGARDLRAPASFFIDADSKPNPGGYPIGGLTVVTFRNAHLAYALTWFALAVLAAIATGLVLRSGTVGERATDRPRR